jgi:AGZA family xanthine/uracil permease-like MFS transporter
VLALDRFFEISSRGSTLGRELRGGLATFLTMSYILVANPAILAHAGVPFASAVASTALAAGICCLLMGLVANFPLALASGMGLNAVVAFQITKAAGSWQTAMGLIFWDGVVILVLVLLGLREAMMAAIPRDLRRAIGAGIGLFIAFIGAVNARLVVVPGSTIGVLAKDPTAALPPVGAGSLAHPHAMVALAGLAFTAFLMARRVRGAILLGIGLGTGLGLLTGLSKVPDVLGWPSFELLFAADIRGALRGDLVAVLLAVLLVDFFDTLGTVTAISEAAALTDERGQVPNLRRILIVDSVAASIGGLCGASSVTSYIESAAGTAEGARTGLHSVVTGLLFLCAAFLAPIAGMIPAAATAPALILVGFLMCEPITRIDFGDLETALPAFVTLVMLPVTYSITHGIGYGFITYVAIQVLSLRWRDVHPLMYGAALLFAAYFRFGG